MDKLIGVPNLNEPVQVPLLDGDSFKLLIRSDYYVHFDNGHNETCETGYLQLPVKADDSIRLIDFSNRTKFCANIPKFTIRLFQSSPRGTYSMAEDVLVQWLKWLYKKDGSYMAWDFDPVEDMPVLRRKSSEDSIQVSVRMPPTDQQWWLAIREGKGVFLRNDKQVPFPDEATEALKKSRFVPGSFVVPVAPNDTVEIRPVPNWEEEEMETALHEVLVTAPRPITKDELWDQAAKKLEHGRPNDRATIFQRLEKQCQEWGTYNWYDTEMGTDLMKETHELRMEKIFQKPYTAHIFFRALDHNPGGNSHYNTIRYSWEVKEDKSMVHTAFEYLTFDGTQSFVGPWKPSTTDDPMDTVRKLEALVQDVASSSASVNSLFNILDTTSNDTEAELVEWSTVEIVVYTSYWWDELSHLYPARFQEQVKGVTEANSTTQPFNRDNLNLIIQNLAQVELPGIMIPAFRLQQRSVYGPQWNYDRMTNHTRWQYDRRVEGNQEQKALIHFLHYAIGMKKVTEWQWGKKDECRACAEQSGAHSVEVMYGGYQPCFFRETNVTPSWR